MVFNLLFCQKGVCAYSEILLCKEPLYEINRWNNGRYQAPIGTNYFGSLDHFNSGLKKNKAWLWDNLFMVHSDLNRDKAQKEISILPKPDTTNYAPENYLDYDIVNHIFFQTHYLKRTFKKK